jgi:hypothetical protein
MPPPGQDMQTRSWKSPRKTAKKILQRKSGALKVRGLLGALIGGAKSRFFGATSQEEGSYRIESSTCCMYVSPTTSNVKRQKYFNFFLPY